MYAIYIQPVFCATELMLKKFLQKMQYWSVRCNYASLGRLRSYMQRERERENINKMNECFLLKNLFYYVSFFYTIFCVLLHIYIFFCRYNLRRISHTLTLTEIEFFYTISLYLFLIKFPLKFLILCQIVLVPKTIKNSAFSSSVTRFMLDFYQN